MIALVIIAILLAVPVLIQVVGLLGLIVNDLDDAWRKRK